MRYIDTNQICQFFLHRSWPNPWPASKFSMVYLPPELPSYWRYGAHIGYRMGVYVKMWTDGACFLIASTTFRQRYTLTAYRYFWCHLYTYNLLCGAYIVVDIGTALLSFQVGGGLLKVNKMRRTCGYYSCSKITVLQHFRSIRSRRWVSLRGSRWGNGLAQTRSRMPSRSWLLMMIGVTSIFT